MFTLEEIRERQGKLVEHYVQRTPWLQKAKGEKAEMTETHKQQLVTLLENQKLHLKEYTTSSAVAPFTTYALPLIRRIYSPDSILGDIASIQAMPQPVGKIFFMDFVYDNDLAPVQRGQRVGFRHDEGRTLNDARNYSKGQVRGEVLGTGNGVTDAGGNVTGTTEFEFNRFYTPHERTKFTPVRENHNLNIYVDSAPQRVIFRGEPAAGEVRVYSDVGNIRFGTAPATGATITADYDLKFEGDDSRIPELSMQMTSDTMDTTVRKLVTRYTLEAEQDFRTYHGGNLDDELVTVTANEIRREIEREVIWDIFDAATDVVNWDARYPGTASGYSRNEYEETLIKALNVAESRIYRKRGVGANFMLVGTDVAVRLQNMRGFQYTGGLDGGVIQDGPYRLGSFQNRFRVIVDPAFENDTIVLGHRGEGIQNTGYVYGPHIGLIATDRIMDIDFTPRKGFMRRDGKKLISSDFYTRVTIQTQ